MTQITLNRTLVMDEAKSVAQHLEQAWDSRLEQIIDFCLLFPEYFPNKQKINGVTVSLTSYPTVIRGMLETYMLRYVTGFYQDRDCILTLQEVGTKPDPAVDTVLQAFSRFRNFALIKKHHRKSMAAENLLGSLLERYLAPYLQNRGWTWCCGNTVKNTDFIKFDSGAYTILQVKNRDNSENAASSSVRVNTTIKKWHRINSKSGRVRWEKLPEYDETALDCVSEEGFRDFIIKLNR